MKVLIFPFLRVVDFLERQPRCMFSSLETRLRMLTPSWGTLLFSSKLLSFLSPFIKVCFFSLYLPPSHSARFNHKYSLGNNNNRDPDMGLALSSFSQTSLLSTVWGLVPCLRFLPLLASSVLLVLTRQQAALFPWAGASNHLLMYSANPDWVPAICRSF